MKNEKAKLPQQVLVINSDKGSDKISVELSTIKRAALTLRALYHPLRKTILELIQDNGESIVTDIYKKMKIEQSVCSQHLAILRRAEVVTTRRNGKQIFYSVNPKRIGEIYDLAKSLAQRTVK
ncbi:MAG: winged helix-turn-helix transcriptional regulator [Bacteroidetes bacterium]|nr:winged helix-turn-helix transcriptional regulator [Bacteroidota bacterium]